jgi:hypothetical protein
MTRFRLSPLRTLSMTPTWDSTMADAGALCPFRHSLVTSGDLSNVALLVFPFVTWENNQSLATLMGRHPWMAPQGSVSRTRPGLVESGSE